MSIGVLSHVPSSQCVAASVRIDPTWHCQQTEIVKGVLLGTTLWVCNLPSRTYAGFCRGPTFNCKVVSEQLTQAVLMITASLAGLHMPAVGFGKVLDVCHLLTLPALLPADQPWQVWQRAHRKAALRRKSGLRTTGPEIGLHVCVRDAIVHVYNSNYFGLKTREYKLLCTAGCCYTYNEDYFYGRVQLQMLMV